MIFYLPIHSSDVHNKQSWTRAKPGTSDSYWSPILVAEVQVLRLSFAVFSGSLAGSWIKDGVAGT